MPKHYKEYNWYTGFMAKHAIRFCHSPGHAIYIYLCSEISSRVTPMQCTKYPGLSQLRESRQILVKPEDEDLLKLH